MEQVGEQLTTTLTSFVTVAEAWTSKPIADFDKELPAALYYLAGIESEASPYMNETIQPGDYRVAVLIVCPVSSLEALIAELRTGLAGFEPTGGAFEAFEHISGDTLDINESVVWWRDLYGVRNYQQ